MGQARDKSGTGAPSIFRPWMCEKVIELMKDGCSWAECCLELNISKSTWYGWLDPEHPTFQAEFAEAVNKGKTFAQGWWERTGRRYVTHEHQGTQLNTAAWIYQMKNKFPDEWKDKSVVESKVTVTPLLDVTLGGKPQGERT